MTLTKEKLLDYTLRMKVESLARSIGHTATCYNAIPNFPVNEHQRDSYLNSLVEQCAALEEILNNGE